MVFENQPLCKIDRYCSNRGITLPLGINYSWVRNCFVIDTLYGAWGKKNTIQYFGK
jgi:hypothetical protein